MKIIARDIGFPEGPVVMPDGSVLYVEMRLGKISRVAPDGKTSLVSETGGGPNGLALGPGGKLYVCNNGGVRWRMHEGEWQPLGHDSKEYTGGRIEVVNMSTGKFERMYDQCDGRSLCAPNDIVFDANGDFWFTDPGCRRRWDRDNGAVYWAKGDGSQIKRVLQPLNHPNGIGLSPDGRRLYVADTSSGRLWGWDISGPGEVKRFREPNQFGGWLVGATGDLSRFDSLKVTASGKICVGTLGNGGITEIWPEGGTLRHHPLPDAHTTNLAFGGADMCSAYVTLSGHGWLVEVRWHEPGLKLNFN